MQIDIDKINSKNKMIDIRDLSDFNYCHYKKSINIPRIKLMSDPDKYINKKDEYYLICDKGTVSLSCCKVLNALGYKCYSIKDGIEGIKDKNLLS